MIVGLGLVLLVLLLAIMNPGCSGLFLRRIRSVLQHGVLLFVVALVSVVLSGCAGLVSSASSTGNPPPQSALAITNVQAPSATTSTSQIVWTTNVAADSAVDYGTSTSYGSSTPVDSAMVTSHQVTLSGLAASSTYYYQVRSSDSKNNHASSGGHPFKTAGFSIAGTINPATGGSGATLTLSGAASSTTTADSLGNYTFAGLANGTYTVAPSHAGFTFTPSSQSTTVNGANVTGVNFTDTAQTFSISGTISPTAGGSGATVTLSGAAGATTTANSSGAYTFTGLASGAYTITPSNAGYTFTPMSQNVTVSTVNVTGVNFTDNAAPGAPTITTQPANQTVTAGQTATFAVVAAGTTPLSYQWQKNGVNIAGATSASYTTPATTTADSGATFQVVVSNTAGTVASAVATLTVTGVPPGAVVISACSDIQTAVNSNPAGTTFYLQACTYRQQSISPNTGDTFLGETGAILAGSKLISTFTASGSYWVASGQASPTIDSNSSASCMGDSPLCTYETEVFIDDTKLKPVSSLSAVISGTWYFSSGNIYFADDPNGHKVEVSVTAYAFNNTGSNVTLKNLIIEKYANPSQTGAVCPQESNCSWTVDSNEIRLNHGGGIRVGSNAKVLSNYIHHNGQIGILGLGSGIVVDGNEIAFNNDAGYNYGWEAGGTKFLYTNNVIIRNNYSHDNRGPGLWTDYNNFFMTFESNRVERNKDWGIATELCMDGTIRYNYVAGTTSDLSPTRLWNNGGIGIIDTRRNHVYGNTLFNNTAGIVGVRTTRSGPLPGSGGETVGLSDMDIHDNLMIQSTNIAAGAVDASDPAIYTSLNNRYYNNTYKIGSLTGIFYQWPGGMTSAQWQAAGQDTTGTWLSPTDPAFPSTKFDTGNRLQTITSADVRSLPSTVDGTLLGTLSLGNLGTVTKVRGPIFTGGSWWWQVHYDSGLQGWTTENSLAKAP